MVYRSRLGGATIVGDDNFANEVLRRTFKETKHLSPKTEKEKNLEKLKSCIVIPGQDNEQPSSIIEIFNFQSGEIRQQRLMTLGNFSLFTGQAKSKKTYLSSALIAAASTNNNVEMKFIGLAQEGRNNCMYFDTEQARYDSVKIINRAIDLGANLSNLNVFSLRPYSPAERVDLIEVGIEEYSNSHSYFVIDGIADLITNVNDLDQASYISTKLLQWTAKYNIHITAIIHQNKDSNWATGHLGHTLEKKAECVISLRNDEQDNSISHVKCQRSRSAPFNEFEIRIDEKGKLNIDGMKNLASTYPQIRVTN